MTKSFSKEDWLTHFPILESKLGVKEAGIENESLVIFMKKKRKSEDPKEQISFLGVFDCIFDNLEDMYKRKLEERDKKLDEFDEEEVDVAAKRRIEDGLFFQRYFLPYSHIILYRSWLQTDLQEQVLMNELFTLGAGSVTFNLTQEVHGICDMCASDKFAGFQNKSSEDIRLINIKVFKEQKRNKFHIPVESKGTHSDDNSDIDSLASSKLGCNPFVSDDGDTESVKENIDQDLANPFETSENDSDQEELYLDACEICGESFPSEDYVQLHRKIFHNHSLKTKFVEEPESLMTTFIHPSTQSPSHGDCDTVATSSSNADKSDIVGASNFGVVEKKNHIRKRLKY